MTPPPLRVLRRRPAGPGAKHFLAAPAEDPRRRIEFVVESLPGRRGRAVSVSVALGCPVACRVCDAGDFPYGGNLGLGTLLAQVEQALSWESGGRSAGFPRLEVRFTRMGEPSFNPAVLKALERLSSEHPGLVPVLSTVAPACAVSRAFLERLRRLRDRRFRRGGLELRFSLLSTDPEARRALVPVRTWSLEEIAAFGRRWARGGRGKAVLSCALPRGIPFDPEVIARTFSPQAFAVRFTPVHPTRRARRNRLFRLWRRPPADLLALSRRLRRLGFEVRFEGTPPALSEGGAACGHAEGATRRAGYARIRSGVLEPA
ncbi:MAG: hypothetical protein WC969_14560 [Elusimicrobiota bacterium]